MHPDEDPMNRFLYLSPVVSDVIIEVNMCWRHTIELAKQDHKSDLQGRVSGEILSTCLCGPFLVKGNQFCSKLRT